MKRLLIANLPNSLFWCRGSKQHTMRHGVAFHGTDGGVGMRFRLAKP